VIAQGYELIGDRDQAEFNYREAVRQSPEDVVIQSQAAAYLRPTDPGTAELCLRRILSVAPHDAPARQKLAMMLVARGGEKNLREAADLLGDQSPDQLSPPQTKRLQTVLLLRRGDASSRQQAQAILESLIHEADELSADERLILATLYEDQGRLAAAREQLAALANRHDPVPSHLAAYVDYLLRHASAKEAETPLARLQELEPESFRTVFLRAHFLAQQGKIGAVEPMIEEFSHKQLAKSDDAAVQAKLLKRIADLYAELGMTAAAERSYRQLAALSPEGQKPLAMWLVASGRRADAIRACSDAAAAGKSSEAAVALCAVLMGTETSVVDQSMVEGMLAASLREHPKDERLLFHVATLRCAQGRNAEAVELFRKLLSLNPRHVPAMNNLAALLAEDPASTAEAEAQIQKAIEIAGATAELLDTQAVVWMNQGKLSEAIAALREITTGAKVDPRHDFHLALACHRNGAEADARAALQRAESGGLGRQVLTPAERAQWAKLRDLLGVKHAERTPSAVKGGA
jgi:Flp pilus assembly protein TadD